MDIPQKPPNPLPGAIGQTEEQRIAAETYAKYMDHVALSPTIPPVPLEPVPQPNPVEVALVPTEPLVPVEIPPVPPATTL